MSQENNKIKKIVKTIMDMEPSEVLKYTYQADVDTFLTEYSSMIRDICPDITDEDVKRVLDELMRLVNKVKGSLYGNAELSCGFEHLMNEEDLYYGNRWDGYAPHPINHGGTHVREETS